MPYEQWQALKEVEFVGICHSGFRANILQEKHKRKLQEDQNLLARMGINPNSEGAGGPPSTLSEVEANRIKIEQQARVLDPK